MCVCVLMQTLKYSLISLPYTSMFDAVSSPLVSLLEARRVKVVVWFGSLDGSHTRLPPLETSVYILLYDQESGMICTF